MNIIEHIWDALQHAIQKRSTALLIYEELCRMDGISSVQHYFRQQLSPCHVVFVALLHAYGATRY